MSDLYDTILTKFEEFNIDAETLLSYPKNRCDTTKLTYTCVCGNFREIGWKAFLPHPLCNNCQPKKKPGARASGISIFTKLLQENGYSLADPTNKDGSYVNTKSIVDVIDPNGNIYQTSHNRFQGGARSPHFNTQCRLSVKDVQSRVEEAGFEWLPNTIYQNKSVPFDVICHCGNKFPVAIDNIRENRIGCPKCYMYNRKYPWDYIEGMADKFGCTLVTPKEAYKGRETIIEVICSCGEMMVKNVRAFLKHPRCKDCANLKREQTNIEKYGYSNLFGSDLGKDMIKSYWMEKHGVDHNMKVEEIQKKSQDTCFKNFGVKCVLSTKEVRDKAIEAHVSRWGASPGNVLEIRDKMKATNLEKYGAEYPLASKEVQKTIKQNNFNKYGNEVFLRSDTGKKLMIDKYGNEIFLQSDTGKKLMMDKYGNETFLQSDTGKKLMIEKYGNEVFLCSDIGKKLMMDKYGHEMFLHSDTGKQLMIDKYGAPYAMQVPELFEKAQKSAFRLKQYTFPSKRVAYLQGYEWKCVDYLLDKLKCNENNIILGAKEVPKVMYSLKGEVENSRRYFMDIYLKQEELAIEVKSVWTYLRDQEKNIAKWKATCNVCKGGLDIYVFDKDNLLRIRKVRNGEIEEEAFPSGFTNKFNMMMGEFYS